MWAPQPWVLEWPVGMHEGLTIVQGSVVDLIQDQREFEQRTNWNLTPQVWSGIFPPSISAMYGFMEEAGTHRRSQFMQVEFGRSFEVTG